MRVGVVVVTGSNRYNHAVITVITVAVVGKVYIFR